LNKALKYHNWWQNTACQISRKCSNVCHLCKEVEKPAKSNKKEILWSNHIHV